MRDKFLNNKTLNLIIGLGLLFLVCMALNSCKKETKQPEYVDTWQPTCFDINLAKDVVWHPIFSGYDYPTLKSNGDYYENGTLKALWTFDGCNTIKVSNSSNSAYNFSFGIKNLTSDTLEVITARFGVTKFYK